jgi:hypothetical protein
MWANDGDDRPRASAFPSLRGRRRRTGGGRPRRHSRRATPRPTNIMGPCGSKQATRSGVCTSVELACKKRVFSDARICILLNRKLTAGVCTNVDRILLGHASSCHVPPRLIFLVESAGLRNIHAPRQAICLAKMQNNLRHFNNNAESQRACHNIRLIQYNYISYHVLGIFALAHVAFLREATGLFVPSAVPLLG